MNLRLQQLLFTEKSIGGRRKAEIKKLVKLITAACSTVHVVLELALRVIGHSS